MSVSGTCKSCGSALIVSIHGGVCLNCETRAQVTVQGGTLLDPDRTVAGPSTPFDSFSPGAEAAREQVGDYELLREIAHGGMGVVFQARQVSLDRIVALKMIRGERLASGEDIRRFLLEARAAARLQHPNIVAIHEVGESDGQHFYVMDYVAGQSLASHVLEQPLPARRAAQYLSKIARAIHYAHERHILHRDLKPANVLIDEADEPRVTDFGLAKVLQADTQQTLSGTVMGTPSYMSPEQASGRSQLVGPPSDIYSLGAVLYELITGRAPFRGETPIATLRLALETDPVPPRRMNPRIPTDLETICLKCLEKKPEKRYSTALALAEDVDRFLRLEPIQARPIGPLGKAARWCRRKPALATALALCAVLLLTVAIGSPIAAYHINAARLLAEQRELVARRNAYAADMTVTHRAIEDRNYGHALAVLQSHLPKPGEQDVREWEWRHFWQLCQSEETATIATQARPLYGIRMTGGGECFASSDGADAKLWDVATGRLIASRALRQAPLPALSPNRQLAVFPEKEGFIRLFRAPDFEQPFLVITNARSLHSLNFLGNERLAGYDGLFLSFWNPETGEILSRVPAPPGRAFTSTPDWQAVATEESDELFFWRDGSVRWRNKVGQQRQGGQNPHLALSSDGLQLAVAMARGSGTDYSIQLWDTASGERRAIYPVHDATITDLAFSPDKSALATVSYDQTLAIWDVATQKLNRRFKNQKALYQVDWFPGGQSLFTGDGAGAIKSWDLASTNSRGLPLDNSLTSELINNRLGAFSPDGTALVLLNDKSTGLVLNARSARIQNVLTLPWTNLAVAACGPAGTLIALAEHSGTIRLYDVPAATERRHFEHLGATDVHRLVFSPDSTWLASADQTYRLAMWDTRTGALVPGWDKQSFSAGAFSPDNRLFAFALRAAIQIREVKTGQLVQSLAGHGRELNALVFSPDGRLLATTGHDSSVRVWDLQSGKQTARFRGSKGSYYRASFSSSGRRLFVNEWDNAVLFDLDALRPLATLRNYAPIFLDGDTVAVLSQTEYTTWHPASFSAISAAGSKR